MSKYSDKKIWEKKHMETTDVREFYRKHCQLLHITSLQPQDWRSSCCSHPKRKQRSTASKPLTPHSLKLSSRAEQQSVALFPLVSVEIRRTRFCYVSQLIALDFCLAAFLLISDLAFMGVKCKKDYREYPTWQQNRHVDALLPLEQIA